MRRTADGSSLQSASSHPGQGQGQGQANSPTFLLESATGSVVPYAYNGGHPSRPYRESSLATTVPGEGPPPALWWGDDASLPGPSTIGVDGISAMYTHGGGGIGGVNGSQSQLAVGGGLATSLLVPGVSHSQVMGGGPGVTAADVTATDERAGAGGLHDDPLQAFAVSLLEDDSDEAKDRDVHPGSSAEGQGSASHGEGGQPAGAAARAGISAMAEHLLLEIAQDGKEGSELLESAIMSPDNTEAIASLVRTYRQRLGRAAKIIVTLGEQKNALKEKLRQAVSLIEELSVNHRKLLVKTSEGGLAGRGGAQPESYGVATMEEVVMPQVTFAASVADQGQSGAQGLLLLGISIIIRGLGP